MNSYSLPVILMLAFVAPCDGEATQQEADPFLTIHVAADGSAEFRSIQAALDSIPVGNQQRIVISIAKGGYNERLRVDHDRVTLQGADRETTRIWFNFPRSEYDRRYDRLGPGVVNVFGDDVIIQGLTIQNTQPSSEHAFALYGQPNRFILSDCDLLSEGGDTVSLWNTSFGMYYHRNCRFRGGVDFVCPRGWCFVRDSKFEAVGQSAAIWHDGHMNDDMKFVLRNCEFDGPEQFWIGRNHYPSQFYLIDCTFSERMADKPIGVVSERRPGLDPSLWERKYFHNCHREGGDFAWHQDRLPESVTVDQITAAWTFDGKWDAESTTLPSLLEVDTTGQEIGVFFSEPVAGAELTRIERSDGSYATLVAGVGTRRWVFQGGTAAAAPKRFEFEGEQPYGTVASLQPRFVTEKTLPPSEPRKQIKVALAGDSTVASYSAKHHYQGWGWALGECFDDRVTIVNHAKGGRSSKSFRAEGLWDKVLDEEADYVVIQFGHNDNRGKGPERETDPAPAGDYRDNLKRYVGEARDAGAVAILVTPPTRRTFADDGSIVSNEPNNAYADAMRAVASDLDCPLVDLNELTKQLFERMGAEHTDWLQPEGDTTHFTPTGARRIAAIVTEKLLERRPELRRFVVSESLIPRRSVREGTRARAMRTTKVPVAPRFWLMAELESQLPPEVPLWPPAEAKNSGIELQPIDERTDYRDRPRLNRWLTSIGEPTVTYYPASPQWNAHCGVVICPGGGYAGLAIDKEGHDVARWFNSFGVTAAVLKYRVRDYGHPAPRDDVQRAIVALRQRATEFDVRRDRIGVMGFSAGGHVASTAATRFRELDMGGESVSSRPDFAILVYPVISMDEQITHAGSRRGLIGDAPSPTLVAKYSNELQVTGQTPPTLLVHSVDDRAVPIENSLRFYRALLKHEVPAKLLIFETGGHGYGLVAEPSPVAEWPIACERWMREGGWLQP